MVVPPLLLRRVSRLRLRPSWPLRRVEAQALLVPIPEEEKDRPPRRRSPQYQAISSEKQSFRGWLIQVTVPFFLVNFSFLLLHASFLSEGGGHELIDRWISFARSVRVTVVVPVDC